MNYPQYVSHKKVSAVKIASVDPGADGSVTLHLEGGFDSVVIPHHELLHKPRPSAGYYMVVYEGSYRSFSPADVFEGGYTPLTDDAPAPQDSAEETDGSTDDPDPEVEDAENNHGQQETAGAEVDEEQDETTEAEAANQASAEVPTT